MNPASANQVLAAAWAIFAVDNLEDRLLLLIRKTRKRIGGQFLFAYRTMSDLWRDRRGSRLRYIAG